MTCVRSMCTHWIARQFSCFPGSAPCYELMLQRQCLALIYLTSVVSYGQVGVHFCACTYPISSGPILALRDQDKLPLSHHGANLKWRLLQPDSVGLPQPHLVGFAAVSDVSSSFDVSGSVYWFPILSWSIWVRRVLRVPLSKDTKRKTAHFWGPPKTGRTHPEIFFVTGFLLSISGSLSTP